MPFVQYEPYFTIAMLRAKATSNTKDITILVQEYPAREQDQFSVTRFSEHVDGDRGDQQQLELSTGVMEEAVNSLDEALQIASRELRHVLAGL